MTIELNEGATFAFMMFAFAIMVVAMAFAGCK